MATSRYVGGTLMSRSSSASSIPDGRYNYYQASSGWGKRPFNFEGAALSDQGARPSKRPRFGNDRFDAERQPAFYTIKEAWRPTSQPNYHGLRPTSTGLEIAPHDLGNESDWDIPDIWGDKQDARAANEVHLHFHKRMRDSKEERVLRSLICPKFDFQLDDIALDSILYAANEVFFRGRLRSRVRWDWSDSSSAEYNSKIIGTTNLREARDGGFETLILLSPHHLKNERYNRRLVISTFLHELIHSYLFICCGFTAKRHGGHTKGFHRIAKLIDDWAGTGRLFLTNMEADLDDFLRRKPEEQVHQCYDIYGCNTQPSNDFRVSPAIQCDGRWSDIR